VKLSISSKDLVYRDFNVSVNVHLNIRSKLLFSNTVIRRFKSPKVFVRNTVEYTRTYAEDEMSDYVQQRMQ
jgi:hypothetical protein